MPPAQQSEVIKKVAARHVVTYKVPEPETGDDEPEPDRRWYTTALIIVVMCLAYVMLVLGWFLETIGRGCYWFGEQIRDGARNIE